jgi:ERCC4-type nuclease
MIELGAASSSEPDDILEELADNIPQFSIEGAADIDYAFFGEGRSLWVERKEWANFIHSFLIGGASGEMQVVAQIRKMAEKATFNTLVILLLEGSIVDKGNSVQVGGKTFGIPFFTLDNFLVKMQGWGIRIAYSKRRSSTAARLLSLANLWLSSKDTAPVIRLPKPPVRQLATLMTFPGVGYKRAWALLRDSDCLEEAITKLVTGYKSGLGSKTQQDIRDYLEGP